MRGPATWVPVPVMPIGVEHLPVCCGCGTASPVPVPVMPIGVEHRQDAEARARIGVCPSP